MNYFSQIIFPPLLKPMIIPTENEKIIFPGGKLNLDYWFEYTGISTRLMVRCPCCNRTYQYSQLQKDTEPYEIASGINDNLNFFASEFSINCPDKYTHINIEI